MDRKNLTPKERETVLHTIKKEEMDPTVPLRYHRNYTLTTQELQLEMSGYLKASTFDLQNAITQIRNSSPELATLVEKELRKRKEIAMPQGKLVRLVERLDDEDAINTQREIFYTMGRLTSMQEELNKNPYQNQASITTHMRQEEILLIQLYDRLPKYNQVQIQSRIQSFLKQRALSTPIAQFTLLQKQLANGSKLALETQEQYLSEGFSSEYVSLLRSKDSKLKRKFIIKYHQKSKHTTQKVDLETRIYSGSMTPYNLATRFPTRITQYEITSKDEKQYLVTVSEFLSGKNLNQVKPTPELLVRVKTEIESLQISLKQNLSSNEYKILLDEYWKPSKKQKTNNSLINSNDIRYAYDQKLCDILKQIDIICPTKNFKELNDILNDEKYQELRTITIDANPSNIRVRMEENIDAIGVFDLTGLRYQLPYDDWVRCIDFPGFIPDKKRDSTIKIFVGELNKQFNLPTEPVPIDTGKMLFHTMAVYRNLWQMAQRYQDSAQHHNPSKLQDDARHFYSRAMMSAKEIGLEHIIPQQQIEEKLRIKI